MANTVAHPSFLVEGWDSDSLERNGRLECQRRENNALKGRPFVVTERELQAERQLKDSTTSRKG